MNILMPQLGETVAEGKITKWFKAAGEAVAPGDLLFEIETDKTSMEVPATSAGRLAEIRVPEGSVAPVGAVVGVIADGAAAPAQAAGGDPAPAAMQSSPPAAAQAATMAAAPASPLTPAPAGVQGERALGSRLRGNERNSGTPAAGSPMELFSEVRTPERNFGPARIAGGIVVTPLARRLASERGIDLSRVTGSGPHGRIVAADVESHAPAPGPAIAGGAGAAQVAALYRDVPFSEVPLDAMRRTIAARLIEAKQTVPHFYLSADIEIDRLLAAREEANAAARDGHGASALRLSLTDFIVKAWALALVRVPAANAVWAGDRILRFARADIGVAVALEGGLITPVLRQADSKPVSAIAAEMRDLAARARAKKLRPDEYQGGSSAISNLGMHGVREFAAIINPPHATILAVSAARRSPRETADGGIRFVSQMTVTLSCDHRVVDGALGAELLAAFKRLIEAPVTMLV